VVVRVGEQEGWGVGKFFKKIADSVEKAAAMPATVVKVRAVAIRALRPLVAPTPYRIVNRACVVCRACCVSCRACVACRVRNVISQPPPPNLLLPALPWEGVWKEFEAELVKLETQECSNKLRVENGADKVKDVRRAFSFPAPLSSPLS
jgi:hypothetical protein